jgi:hypothetical protein
MEEELLNEERLRSKLDKIKVNIDDLKETLDLVLKKLLNFEKDHSEEAKKNVLEVLKRDLIQEINKNHLEILNRLERN